MIYSAVEYLAGDMIFRQGEDGSLMYLVQGGAVEVLQELGGMEKQIAVLERGDFFGEMSLLEAEPRSHSVRAISPVKLVEIDRAGLQKMLVRNPEIAVRMVRKLSHRLATAEDMLFRAYSSAHAESHPEPAPAVQFHSCYLVDLKDGTALKLDPTWQEARVGRLDPVNQIFPDVDLTVLDPQFSVSRRHARILRQPAGFQIVEEQATNGTFLNGKRISSRLPLELRAGDEIMFGAVRMRFMLD